MRKYCRAISIDYLSGNFFLSPPPLPPFLTLFFSCHFIQVHFKPLLLWHTLQIGILAEALGGVNVGNCGHACEARPCGDAECRPVRERFTCQCRLDAPHPCPAPDDYTPLIPPPEKTNAVRYERAVPSFTGSESYLHYNDADTMKRYIMTNDKNW